MTRSCRAAMVIPPHPITPLAAHAMPSRLGRSDPGRLGDSNQLLRLQHLKEVTTTIVWRYKPFLPLYLILPRCGNTLPRRE
jgi:hypothetical protein